MRDGEGVRQFGYKHPSFGKSKTLTDAMLVFHDQLTGPGIAVTMYLNPAFVERVMGIPDQWTSVSAAHASRLWGTRSRSRKR